MTNGERLQVIETQPSFWDNTPLPPTLANLKLATWGCSHGSGFLGTVIRDAEVHMSKSTRFPEGDRTAAWAGHCFVYVGIRDFAKPGCPPDMDHAIIEAEAPKVVMSRASRHPDAIWAINQPLTDEQRVEGALTALALLGHDYDTLAYAYYATRTLGVEFSKNLGPLFTATAQIGPICSGVVVRCQEQMHVDLGPLKTAAVEDPDFVCPADCLRWGLDNNWMSAHPPAWA